jgi:hypothetical protein
LDILVKQKYILIVLHFLVAQFCLIYLNGDNERSFYFSASDNVPSLFLSFGADTWPAVLFISHQIFSAFNISNYIGSFSFKSSSAVSDGHFNICGTFNSDGLSAFSSFDNEDGFGLFSLYILI